MPSVSDKQRRLMAAACHGSIDKPGLKKSVACEFNAADKGKKHAKKPSRKKAR